ncbi:MAG: ABC transporter permease [Acidobacteriia bacterium]|nr:ABC transporter permease [Terriglobia bacterium]
MDLRYALRLLARSPGFTAIAVVTLAVGIGINTIVFTLYSAVALKPIAARAPQELVRISGNQNGLRLDSFSLRQYTQMCGSTGSFTGMIASSDPQTIVGRIADAPAAEAQVLRARFVSDNYFSVLGVVPQIGRGFQEDDREAVVLGHDFWTKKLQGDPAALTKTILVQGTALHVVGVAPEKFAGTGVPPQMPNLWIPLAAQTEVLPGVDWLRDDNARQLQVLARRKPGIRVVQASAELDVLASGWPLVEGKPAHLSARPATFFQADGGEFETFAVICQILMIAVGLILLIGAINLVNLLFARHATREREFAVRLAMGASRFHLVRQLCTESLLLGVFGGAVGLMLSLWACEWIRLAITGSLQRITGGLVGVFLDVSPDWRVFAYTAAISAVIGIAIGIWPSLRASRRDVISVLKQASAGSARGQRKRNLLISAQVAACLMLLAGAGLLFRGVWRSGRIDPGFEIQHVALAGINVKTVAVSPAARSAVLRQAVDRIQGLPEVASVAWADRPPFLGHGSFSVHDERGVWVVNCCLFNLVSDRYFETLGIPLLAGRNFTPAEIESAAPVMVISDVAARRIWPGKDPLGRSIPRDEFLKRLGILPRDSYTVIGVVKGVRSTYLSKPDEGFLYYPQPLSNTFGAMLVRTRSLPQVASRSIFEAIGAVDANLPSQTFIVGLDQAPVQLQRMMAEAPALVAFVLGILALLLASLGIFGLVSQLVTQRTREIAIRVSLGAQVGDVIRMVMAQTLRPVLLGSAAGMAGALAISVLLAKMMGAPDMPDLTYGSGAFDPLTFSGVLSVLTLVILIASFLPVRRATQIAPAEALRNE